MSEMARRYHSRANISHHILFVLLSWSICWILIGQKGWRCFWDLRKLSVWGGQANHSIFLPRLAENTLSTLPLQSIFRKVFHFRQRKLLSNEILGKIWHLIYRASAITCPYNLMMIHDVPIVGKLLQIILQGGYREHRLILHLVRHSWQHFRLLLILHLIRWQVWLEAGSTEGRTFSDQIHICVY